MSKAYVLDDTLDDDQLGDPRLPHVRQPEEHFSKDKLAIIGVHVTQFDAENYQSSLRDIMDEKQSDSWDRLTITKPGMTRNDEAMKQFFTEHFHSDDQVQCIIAGSGYFDIRDAKDRWIRIPMVAGELITLPAGLYHRFTVDTKDYVEMIRIFHGSLVWTPIRRTTEDHPTRQQYRKRFLIA